MQTTPNAETMSQEELEQAIAAEPNVIRLCQLQAVYQRRFGELQPAGATVTLVYGGYQRRNSRQG